MVGAGQDLTDIQFPYPLGLVVGSEQKGVRDVILKHVDLPLTIPMAIDRMSFNVAHATAIICYEIKKQKNQRTK